MDASTLANTLNLAVGESAELVDLTPETGDYRVYYVGLAETSSGGQILTFELHRQAPGYRRIFFEVLTLIVGPADPDGLSEVESYCNDAGADLADLPQLLPELARIVATLKDKKKPSDDLLLPFLGRPGQLVWTQSLVAGVAS
jgi:hypothetical protein